MKTFHPIDNQLGCAFGISPRALAMFAASKPEYKPMATELARIFSKRPNIEHRRAVVRQMQIDDMNKRTK